MDAFDAAITQAEVEKALPRLSSGKAAGNAGWPAELLWHALYHIQLEDGRSVKVWMLANILAAFLNACFIHNRLPACGGSALGPPCCKKEVMADIPNCSLIAVGEPLHRLYTIILNARLVAWSGKHGLRSPVQAVFRPRHSPMASHHLFALQHFVNRASLWRRPLIVAFVELQKAYDTVQHDLLWAHLDAIGVHPCMVAAIRSLYSSSALFMRVGSMAGPPLLQQKCSRGALSAPPCLAASLMACMAI